MRTRGYILIAAGLLIGVLGVIAETTGMDHITSIGVRQLLLVGVGSLLVIAGSYWSVAGYRF